MRINLVIEKLENIIKMHVPTSSEDRENALKSLEIIKEALNK